MHAICDNFTCKAVMVEMRKTCNEFSKRIDKDLPFYYYTSSNERFHEGERPDLNKFVKLTTSLELGPVNNLPT